MKSVKLSIVAFVSLLFIYTGCKKTNTGAQVTPTSNNAALSKQIALNLYKSISGNYGAADVGDGIKAPASLVKSQKGLRINDITPYCGYTIDTTLNFTTQVGDTSKTVDSHYKFIYTCNTSKLDGYFLSDSITYTDQGALFYNKYITGQNYTVTRTSNNNVYMHGYIGTSFHTSDLNASQQVIAYNYADTQYIISALNINIASGNPDITSGVVSFVSNISYKEASAPNNIVSGHFTGSITYLGNYKAKTTLIIQGVAYNYMVNMLTGNVDPI